MATTSPDNLRTPNPGDPYNLVADLATFANDVQVALNKKVSNLLTGTAAQRVAATGTATNGMLWQDTDGIKMIWRKDGASWVPAIWQWSGTTAQMDGFTQAPVGFEWLDTANQISYRKVAAGWVPFGGAWTLNVDMGSTVISAPAGVEVLVRSLGTGRSTPSGSKFKLAAYGLGLYGATGVELRWRYTTNGTTPTTSSPVIPFGGLKRLTGLSGNVTSYDFMTSFDQPSTGTLTFGLFLKGAPSAAGNIYFDNWSMTVTPGG